MAGRRPKAKAGVAPHRIDGGRADGTPKPGPPADELPRGPGGKLVHDLGGTLAAIGLHLRMASEHPLPSVSAQHLDAAANALQSSRGQLTELAELLQRFERPKT
jgi:hypothetical protein